jgi:hypothetical protein
MRRDNKHGNEAGAGVCVDGSTAVVIRNRLSKAVKMRMLVALLEEVRLWAAKRIDAKITFVLNLYRLFQNAGIITYATLLYFNMIRRYNFVYMHINVSVTRRYSNIQIKMTLQH